MKTTTDANGNFTIGSALGIQARAVRAFAAQVVGNNLVVSCPKDGALDLSPIDASGRSLWDASTVASQGSARVALPTGLSHGAVFLRIRHGEGVQYQAVTMGASGVQLAAPTTRSLAVFPVLAFTPATTTPPTQ